MKRETATSLKFTSIFLKRKTNVRNTWFYCLYYHPHVTYTCTYIFIFHDVCHKINIICLNLIPTCMYRIEINNELTSLLITFNHNCIIYTKALYLNSISLLKSTPTSLLSWFYLLVRIFPNFNMIATKLKPYIKAVWKKIKLTIPFGISSEQLKWLNFMLCIKSYQRYSSTNTTIKQEKNAPNLMTDYSLCST